MKNMLKMGPTFISSKSLKNIACLGKKTNRFKEIEIHIGLTPEDLVKTT